MKTAQVEVKLVRVGDSVLSDTGEPVRIKEIGKGMPMNTIELRWLEGVELKWMALNPAAMVERVV